MIHVSEPASDIEAENLPMPLLVAKKWDFDLQFQVIDSKYYYAINDWIAGLATAEISTVRSLWIHMQKSGGFDQMLNSIQRLSYVASDGKTYQREFTDNIGLY